MFTSAIKKQTISDYCSISLNPYLWYFKSWTKKRKKESNSIVSFKIADVSLTNRSLCEHCLYN